MPTVLPRPLAAFFLIATTCSTPPPEPKAPPAAAESAPHPDDLNADPGLRAAYIAAVQADAGPEYRFRPSDTQRLIADNPVHGLKTAPSSIDTGTGLRVASATPDTDGRRLALSLAGPVCAGTLAPLAAATARTQGNRVEYARPGLTEWYLNGPLGIEQGFTIAQRPSCADPGLELAVNVGDAVVARLHGGDQPGSYVELRDRSDKPWLRYSDLYAADARGHALPARLAVVEGRIHLRVDDSAAVYPVTIDPLVWTVQQQIQGGDTAAEDYFARSVALSGTTALLGAFQAGLTGKAGAGAAYVFVRAGTAWTQQAKLTAPDAAADAAFGYSVALSGNSAVIGAPGATQAGKAEAGAAYIYTRTGTTWTFQQRLTASDAAASDQLGDSVAIDGNSVALGADYADVAGRADAGAVYVFVRSGTTWSEQQKLTGSAGSDGDHLGQAVALSGDSVAAGAPYADVSGKTSAGTAYLFTRTGTTWREQQKLAASDAAAGDGFGSAATIAGDTLLVGTPNADVAGQTDAGAAYAFARTGTTWAQKQKLAATTPVAAEAFGQSVALSGNSALIGADGGSGGGAAYVFSLAAMVWSQQQLLASPIVGADGNFGRSVALDGDTGVVGAPYSTVGGKSAAGVAFALVLGMTKPTGQVCASAVECATGYCVDGVCCASACGGGTPDCQACSVAAGATTDGTCGTAKMGSLCRAAASGCDEPESCDGMATSCPADKFKASTTLCRGAIDLCDVAEYCTGAAAACPSDSLKPSGSECRASIGACDSAEKCNGVTTDCPTDTYKPNTAECRPSAGICDVADFCTGSGPACPSDQLKPSATPCRAAAGVCDAVETCTGASIDCPADTFKKVGTECRAAAGPCDAAEACPGTGADCPVDVFKPSTTECRAAAGACDSAELCTGANVTCPADQFKPSGIECRRAAGACDLTELCPGGSPACPADTFQPAAVLCRDAAGPCDLPESCTGSDGTCPTDSFRGEGLTCSGGSCRSGMCRQEADLRLSLTSSSSITREQEPVSLLLALTNMGVAAATAVKVTIDVPPGAKVVNGGGDGWSCQSIDSGLSCERPRLDIGVGLSLTADVVPPKVEPAFTVTARVASAEFDPNPDNNSATLTIQNQSPTHDGGCAMAPGRAPNPSVPAALWALGLCGAALLRRRARRGAGALLALFAIGGLSLLGCNANVLGDRSCTDPDDCEEVVCDDPNNCSSAGGDIDGLIITPIPVVLTSVDGSQPTQQFSAAGHRPDGSTAKAVKAVFAAPSNSIGLIDQHGLFTASGEVGGTLTLTAKFPAAKGGWLTANFQVTVNIVRNIVIPGAPVDASSKFGGTPVPDASKAAPIAYPLNGVLMPQNVYPADIQWSGGATGDLYRVIIKKPNVTVTAYAKNSGAGYDYHYLPDAKAWSGVAQSNPDADAVLTVDRWDSASNTVYGGDAVKMHFSRGSLLGSIYYWDIVFGKIRRIDDGTAKAVDFMPSPPTSPVDGSNCVGCHVVSRDGRYMLGRLGGGSNVAGVFDLTKNLTVSPAPSEYGIDISLPKFFISSWKPDNTRLIASNFTNIMLIDVKTGKQIAPAAGTLPTDGIYPNWSPDGNSIAYISGAIDWGGQAMNGNLSVLPVTGPDAFGAPRLLHTATSIPGATADTWPSWSPDSKWLAFQSGTDSRSDDARPGSLYLIAPDGKGLVRLTNATGGQAGTETVYVPNFSPFNVDGYYWLTFVTHRAYGNAQVGTAGSPHQQLWVAAVKNSPVPGQDPSFVPYWLPGQVTSAKNISAYWAPKACRLTGDACTVGAECCSTVCSMGTCQVPPPTLCRQQNETCGGAADCCAGLTCNDMTHICENQIG